jgi:hypothetical protein
MWSGSLPPALNLLTPHLKHAYEQKFNDDVNIFFRVLAFFIRVFACSLVPANVMAESFAKDRLSDHALVDNANAW